MGNENNTDLVSVQLPFPFVQGLLALTNLLDKRVTAALRSALEEHQREPTTSEPVIPPSASSANRADPLPHNTNLVAEILGQRVSGATLPDLFARSVDVIHELEPSAIERLAGKKTHARRYVARRREDIHLKSPHLETMETGSGWWISANVSEQQVTTAMRLLANAANLKFGKDFIFPL
jgi:hypothetical protein